MKEILGVLGNVRSGWKSTVVGCAFILTFFSEYFTSETDIELVSIHSVILGIGLALLFAPGKNKEE